ncbi:MAG: hypothetical protein GYB24_04625 [Rhodobacteraceae bacterium]|nr:hypothetical protein [Paracoccaceae bacterium]
MTEIFRILIAPLVWFVSFSAIYGLHGVLCETGPGAFEGWPVQRVVLISPVLLAIALQVVNLWMLYQPRFTAPAGLLRFVSRAGGWTGLVATVWTLFPVVALSACT